MAAAVTLDAFFASEAEGAPHKQMMAMDVQPPADEVMAEASAQPIPSDDVGDGDATAAAEAGASVQAAQKVPTTAPDPHKSPSLDYLCNDVGVFLLLN